MYIQICQGQITLCPPASPGALSLMMALVLGRPSAVILPELTGVSSVRKHALLRSSLFFIHTWPGPCHGPSHLPLQQRWREVLIIPIIQTGTQRLGADWRHSW